MAAGLKKHRSEDLNRFYSLGDPKVFLQLQLGRSVGKPSRKDAEGRGSYFHHSIFEMDFTWFN